MFAIEHNFRFYWRSISSTIDDIEHTGFETLQQQL